MRNVSFLAALLTLALAAPLEASQGQSYFTVAEPGTTVRSHEDDREIEARVNLPVFRGDEVVTGRRGRAEIRLSDGNVIGLDRSTAVRFKSMLDAYESDSSQTVIELRYGHLAVQRTDAGREYVRVDTDSGSYLASREAVYAVDSDRGTDRIVVFDGSVEVRTPQRTEKVRAGEEAKVDDRGLYAFTSRSYASADDFERWFLARAERYSTGTSRYLDRSLAYADYDLGSHGSWVYVGGFRSHVWRPRVASGWRPYFHGEWVSGPGGVLVWSSYEPWGWVPYHYGRWAYDSFYGWVWVPGNVYSPAWVYWMYGPSYVGWAPAGYWDHHAYYYDWCYRPRSTWDSGWYGRVRVGDIDVRPWTFVQPNQIVGVRVDRAAVTADVVRDRLLRGSAGGFATVSSGPARFGRNELRDPAQAVNNVIRRAAGGGDPGSVADVTPFIRRDKEVPATVRERIVRGQPQAGSAFGSGGTGGGVSSVAGSGGRVRRGEGGGSPAWGGASGSEGATVRRGGESSGSGSAGGGIVRRGGESAPAWRGEDSSGGSGSGGTVRRGGDSSPSRDSGSGSSGGTIRRGGESSPSRGGSGSGGSGSGGTVKRGYENLPGWRDSGSSDSGSGSSGTGTFRRDGAGTDPAVITSPPAGWRNRGVIAPVTPPDGTVERRDGSSSDRGASGPAPSDVPRRVIDRIGGPRLVPSDSGSSRSDGPRYEPSRERSSAPPHSATAPRVERSSPPPRASSPQPSGQSNDAGSSEGRSGGRVKRDRD